MPMHGVLRLLLRTTTPTDKANIAGPFEGENINIVTPIVDSEVSANALKTPNAMVSYACYMYRNNNS